MGRVLIEEELKRRVTKGELSLKGEVIIVTKSVTVIRIRGTFK